MDINWDALAAIGEIASAVAVLVTLLYLAVQVNLARRSTNASLEDNLNSAWSREIRAWGDSPEAAALMAEGFQDYANLPQEKKLMFHVRMDALMLEYQKQRRLYEQGAWDGALHEVIQGAILRMLVCPGGKAWWDETGSMYVLHEHWQKLIESDGDGAMPLNEYSWLRLDRN